MGKKLDAPQIVKGACVKDCNCIQYFHRRRNAMSKSDFRMVYKPAPDRLPRWMWRVWGWF